MREVLQCLAAQRRNELRGVAHIRRFVALSAMRFGREVRRIGLDERPLDRHDAAGDVALAKKMIEAGACALQIENQVSDEKQCGHQDGKVTVPHEDFLAKIRAVRPPEPYKGKGVRYVGEHVVRKAGKAAGAVGGGKK